MSKLWISVDPGNKSGVAVWNGQELIDYGVLRKVGNNGSYAIEMNRTKLKYESRYRAWSQLINFQTDTAVVVEEGCGRFTNAVKSQAELRGYIRAIADHHKIPQFEVINVSEWRRVIKEHFAVSWPKDSERCKSLSVQLVKRHFGIDVSNDVSDAILLGVAAVRMGVISC